MARTGENIYKRKDGRWEARYIYRYDAEGKAKYRSVYGISRHQAKQKRLLRIHESMLNVETPAAPTIIFSDLAKNWLASINLRVKESTFVRYSNQTEKHIVPYFGKYQASKISTELIEQSVGHLLKPKEDGGLGLSPKTVEDILILTKNILKFGKCHAHLELHRIKIKKTDKKSLVLPKPVQAKLHWILTKDTDPIKAGILLSLYTGVRIGELCAMKWEDFDLEEQTLHVEKTLQRIQILNKDSAVKTKVIITSPKSKKSIRDIPIPSFLAEILRKLNSQPQSFFLTQGTQYMEPRTLYNHYTKCLKQGRISHYKFHALRHTFSTNYVEAGFDVKSLSEILGHSDVKITLDRYVHSSGELKRNNMEKLMDRLLYSPSEIASTQYI